MGSPVSLRISCICYDSCDALVIWLCPHRVVGHVNDVRDLRRNLANHDLEAIYFLVEQFLNDHAKLAVGPRSMPCRDRSPHARLRAYARRQVARTSARCEFARVRVRHRNLSADRNHRVNLKALMWLQACAIVLFLVHAFFWIWFAAAVSLGAGTAMVYPTLRVCIRRARLGRQFQHRALRNASLASGDRGK